MRNTVDSLAITRHSKVPLGNALEKSYNALVELLAKVPAHNRTIAKIEGTGGMVSIADIVAYQIGWGTLLIGWYNAGINGKTLDMPGDGFSTWDYTGLARHFYTKYRYDSAQEQDQRLHVIVQHILNIIEHEYQTGNLDKIGVWTWCTLASGKQWPLSKWITVNTVSPYKRAATLIRKFLKTE